MRKNDTAFKYIIISMVGIILLFCSCSVNCEDSIGSATDPIQLNNTEVNILTEIEIFLDSEQYKMEEPEQRQVAFYDYLMKLSDKKPYGNESYIKTGSVVVFENQISSILVDMESEKKAIWIFNDKSVDEYVFFGQENNNNDNYVKISFLYE